MTEIIKLLFLGVRNCQKQSVFLEVSTNTWALFPDSYAYSNSLAIPSTEMEFRIDNVFISLSRRQHVNSILETL